MNNYFCILQDHTVFMVTEEDTLAAVKQVHKHIQVEDIWGDLNEIEGDLFIRVRRMGVPKHLIEVLCRVADEVYLLTGNNQDTINKQIAKMKRPNIATYTFLSEQPLACNMIIQSTIDKEAMKYFDFRRMPSNN